MDREVMRAYRVNPLSIFPARSYEEDRVVRPFFGRPSILTSRAEDIRHVLLDNADNYRRTRAGVRILRPLIGDGLFMATGAAWRAQRRTIAPAFVPSAVPSFAKAAAEALIPARRDLLDRAQAPVDLLGWLQTLTLDVAGPALFSLPLNDQLGRDIRNQIGGYGLRYGRPSFLDFAVPLWLPSPRDLGRFRFRRRLFALVDRLVAARRRLPDDPRRRDLFDLLVAADWMAGGDSPGKLRNQVATLIVAGHETTAIALFWAFDLLAREPDWQERLAAEAMAQDLTPAGIGETVSALTLSRAVVDEAMRLFP
ncbi:MAG: cytochrome P450, partial [Mycobacterium sp.]